MFMFPSNISCTVTINLYFQSILLVKHTCHKVSEILVVYTCCMLCLQYPEGICSFSYMEIRHPKTNLALGVKGVTYMYVYNYTTFAYTCNVFRASFGAA